MSHFLNQYATQNSITKEQAIDDLVRYAFDLFDIKKHFNHSNPKRNSTTQHTAAMDQLMTAWVSEIKKNKPFHDVLQIERNDAPHANEQLAVDYIKQKMYGDFYFTLLGSNNLLRTCGRVFDQCGKQGISTLMLTIYNNSDRIIMASLMQILMNLHVHEMRLNGVSAHLGTYSEHPFVNFEQTLSSPDTVFLAFNDHFHLMNFAARLA